MNYYYNQRVQLAMNANQVQLNAYLKQAVDEEVIEGAFAFEPEDDEGGAFEFVPDAPEASQQMSAEAISRRARANWGKVKQNIVRSRNARRNIAIMVDALTKVGVLGRAPGTKALDQQYWLEKLDKSHRFGDLLKVIRDQHGRIRRHNPQLNIPISFFDWITRLDDQQLRNKLKLTDEAIKLFNTGVAYLDTVTRKSHKVSIQNKRLHNAEGALLDTSNMETAFSGKGFAIFIMSPRGELFVGSHRVGEMHHSSFLSGNPVMGAGELVVKQGSINMISAKSGHYKPGHAELLNVLSNLGEKTDIQMAKVRLYKKGPNGQPVTNENPQAKDDYTGRPVGIGHSVPVYVTGSEYIQKSMNISNDYLTWGS